MLLIGKTLMMSDKKNTYKNRHVSHRKAESSSYSGAKRGRKPVRFTNRAVETVGWISPEIIKGDFIPQNNDQ